MIFRLSVLVAILALAAGQRAEADERNSQEVSARLMQATDGVSGINSQTSGTVTAIARSTLGGGAVQDGDATQILTQWNFRFVIQEGVREGQTITGVNIHCSQDFSPTSMISAPDDNNDQDDGVAVRTLTATNVNATINNGVLDGSSDIIAASPELVNLLVTDNSCYLNFTTNDYPSGELRANLQCSLSTTDSGELVTCASSASSLMASTAIVLSALVGFGALF